MYLYSLLQSGVSEVIYFVEKRLDNPDIAYIASHKLLSLAGVKVTLTKFSGRILLSLNSVGSGILTTDIHSI